MRILKGVHQDGVLGSGELHKVKNQRRVELGLEATRNTGPKSAAGGRVILSSSC